MATSPAMLGIEAKIRRAHERAKEVEALTEDLLDDGPHPMLHVERAGELEVGILEVPTIPPVLSVALGELIHDLRSALDHLVYQLALKIGKTAGVHNYFPVTYDKGEFNSRITRSKSRKGCLDPIPAGHPIVEIIRRHQPYNRRHHYYLPDVPTDAPWDPAMEWLALIHRMWNADKHRTLLRAAYICPATEEEIIDLFAWDPANAPRETMINRDILNQAVEDRHELAKFRFDSAVERKANLRIKDAFPGEIMLGNQPDGKIDVRFGHGVPYQLVGRVDAIFKDLRIFV